MARKETPDVLGDILSGGAVAAPALAPQPTPAASPPARQPARKLTAAKPAAKGQQWEHRLVSFQDYRGWRPRYVDGAEMPNWMAGPLIHEYAGQLGEEGWELVAASAGKQLYGASDLYQLYFKRPKG